MPPLHIGMLGWLRLPSRMPGVEVLGSDPDQDLAAPTRWSSAPRTLCEKPLAASVADGEAMVSACRAAGVRLAVAFPVRFSPAYAAVPAAVASGEAGRALAVSGANNGSMPNRARRWFAEPGLSGGGALMDHTVHIADLLDDLFGDARPVEVYARTNNLMYADEAAVGTAGLGSWSHPRSHHSWGGPELTVVGERATLEMDAFDQKVHGFDERRGRGPSCPSAPTWTS
ncbi:Gfo/Idh/MocA family oxidoreductase [Streptomyces sp. NPDC050703]|uniref:Gfo/Idh/MocA family protein n=1 Tax=Streptomyces sp. NPDC050703 TaxID=3157218 RepID=UPI00342805C0